MEIILINPQELKYEFQYLLSFWGLVVFICFVLFTPKVKRKIYAVVIALGVYSLCAALSYLYTYAHFTHMTINEKDILLHYVNKKVAIEKNDIKDVLYGLPGKTSDNCYISIHSNKLIYKSATIHAKPQECKDILKDITSHLS